VRRLALVPAIGIVLYVAGVILIANAHTGATRAPRLGNFDETLKAVVPPEPKERFTFAVLGDIRQGVGTYGAIMRRIRESNAAFAVITGDLVVRPRPEAFEFFLGRHAALGPDMTPTLAAIGNHDQTDDGDASLFRKYVGPEEFSFVYGGCLFIFADNNLEAKKPRAAEYIRGEIARHKGKVRRVFVFMHIPGVNYSKAGRLVDNKSRSAYLYDLLAQEKIDAVFTGHFHGYVREVGADGTLHLVTGGAGARLQDPSSFHHFILVDVGPDGVKDTLVRIESGQTWWDQLSFNATVYWYPNVVRPWFLALLLAAAAALGWAGARRRKAPNGHA
jgi:1,2-diacylglycerol 3-alpha-glucosyltransferase